MAGTLKSISSKRATIHVPTDPDNPEGDKIRVVYKPRSLNGELSQNILERVEKNPELGQLLVPQATRQFIANVVVEWDLRADEADSEPIPLTDEGLLTVPIAFLEEIVAAIRDDQSVDPKAKS